MERWQGKVAVVTGSSSGIGKAIAEKLVNDGLKVVGLARRKERLTEIENNLKNKEGIFYSVPVDLLKEEEILSAFRWVESNLGGINVIVNSAGINGDPQSVEDGVTKTWERILDTNIKALLIVSREGVKSMRKHNMDDAHIINISSVMGHMFKPFPCYSTYCASKRAVVTISEGLRNELSMTKSKIKVTEISPGLVRTEMIESSPFSVPETAHILEAEDIADCVSFVLYAPPRVLVKCITIRPTGEDLGIFNQIKNHL